MKVDLDDAEYKARHHFHAKWVQPTVLALVAELRQAREVIEACRPVLVQHGGHIRDNGMDDWDPDYRYEVVPPQRVIAAREVLAAYDKAVQP